MKNFKTIKDEVYEVLQNGELDFMGKLQGRTLQQFVMELSPSCDNPIQEYEKYSRLTNKGD